MGEYGLLDFRTREAQRSGLSDDNTTATAITIEGQISGPLQYMAPEQLQGKEADARSDIFAFGCLLHEILSGRKAFSGSSAASLISAIMERQPEPIETTLALDRVIRTCLEKDPDNQFQSTAEARRALDWTPDTGPLLVPLSAGKARRKAPGFGRWPPRCPWQRRWEPT